MQWRLTAQVVRDQTGDVQRVGGGGSREVYNVLQEARGIARRAPLGPTVNIRRTNRTPGLSTSPYTRCTHGLGSSLRREELDGLDHRAGWDHP